MALEYGGDGFDEARISLRRIVNSEHAVDGFAGLEHGVQALPPDRADFRDERGIAAAEHEELIVRLGERAAEIIHQRLDGGAGEKAFAPEREGRPGRGRRVSGSEDMRADYQ